MQSIPFGYTLGWNMAEQNRTLGGLFGYPSLKVRRKLKIPPSHEELLGPMMVAVHRSISSLVGEALHPWGGSVFMARRSF